MESEKINPGKIRIFEIPAEGALGLLALGADGIKAWKEKKKLIKQQEAEKQNQSPSEKIPETE
ncbi:MAG: hypothetical protein ABI855_16035 [Bacteroidota bacterium]